MASRSTKNARAMTASSVKPNPTAAGPARVPAGYQPRAQAAPSVAPQRPVGHAIAGRVSNHPAPPMRTAQPVGRPGSRAIAPTQESIRAAMRQDRVDSRQPVRTKPMAAARSSGPKPNLGPPPINSTIPDKKARDLDAIDRMSR